MANISNKTLALMIIAVVVISVIGTAFVLTSAAPGAGSQTTGVVSVNVIASPTPSIIGGSVSVAVVNPEDSTTT